MLKLQLVLCLCLGFAAQAMAGFGFGACPTVDVVEDFEISKYTGLWYELARYSVIFEAGGKCVTARYTAQDDGSVAVHNSMIQSLLGTTVTIDGYAVLANSSSTEARLNVTLDTAAGAQTAPYDVVDTDYDNYAVVYSCSNYLGDLIKFDFAWILARNSTLSSDYSSKVEAAIQKAGLKKSSFSKTTQDC